MASGRGTGASTGPSMAIAWPAITRCASRATVGASNSVRTGSSTFSIERMRLASRVASSECPPRSKKLSSIPTLSSPSVLANRVASACSVGVRGLREADCTAKSGAGRALRSILPLGVSGSASSMTSAAGTM